MDTIVISIIFLVLLAFAIIKGRHAKDGIGKTPLIYKSIIVQFILNVALILFIIFSIGLLFYNWKLLLVLFLIGFIVEGFIIVPLVEKIFLYIFYRIMYKSKN